MALINWSPKLSVGLLQLDADHIILIGLINQLHDAMQAGRGEELFGAILSTMKQYTVTHFRREEKVMEQNQYPHSEDHKKHHEALIKSLNTFTDKYAQDKNSVTTAEISEFLQGWLINHIQKEDFRYKPYMYDGGDTC